MTPRPDCPECKGDPRGVLLLNNYVPCRTCGTREKVPSTVTLWRPLGKDCVRVPGKSVTALPVASKHIVSKMLGAGASVCEQAYVDERVLDDGKHVFVHYGVQIVRWLVQGDANELRDYMFCEEYETEEEAMAAIGPEARRN